MEVNQNVLLELALYNNRSDRGVRARVYNSAGVEQSGSPFTLSHLFNGLYTNNSWVPTVEGNYVVFYQVFTDGTFATPDVSYSQASETIEVRSIDQDLSSLINGAITELGIPDLILLPDSGTKQYKFLYRLRNATGATKDPDSNSVNISFVDVSGATVLSSTAMTRISAGRYEYTHTFNATDTERPLIVVFDYNINAVATQRRGVFEVQKIEQTVNAIRADYTTVRAAKIDNLDVVLSTRAPASTALDNTVWTNAKAAFIDAAISSRLAAGSYTAPDNSSIAAIKAKTDNLPASPANEVTSAAIKTKTDQLAFTSSRVDANISSAQEDSIVDKVWDEPTAGHVTAGTTGKALTDASSASSPSAIADAVWDEPLSGHTGAGSTGKALGDVAGKFDEIKGTGFDGSQDTLEKISEKEDDIKGDTSALLSSGNGI